MKIDNSVGSAGGLSSGEARTRATRSTSASVPTPSGEKVQLSSLSTRMQEVEAALASVPVADPERIAEIKRAMAEGRFTVDAGKVADGLIESVRQMLSSAAHRA